VGCHRESPTVGFLAKLEQLPTTPSNINDLSRHVAFDVMGAQNMVAALNSVASAPPVATVDGVPPSLPVDAFDRITRQGLSELRAPRPDDFARTMMHFAGRIAGHSCRAQTADAATAASAHAALAATLPSVISPVLQSEFATYRERASAFTEIHSVECAQPIGWRLVIARNPNASDHEFVLLRLDGRH
jgi:hypothetical protein